MDRCPTCNLNQSNYRACVKALKESLSAVEALEDYAGNNREHTAYCRTLQATITQALALAEGDH